ncbi:unnamed protein product [Thelazia callipaeda]|uniref:GATA-type domain-containing protein n=1 Tax=Thelazia callipaeda TaxID=103827 RepID=A0A0N5CXU6_THECL|nr:unnamed protein product [Thelazia callipaeda]
MDEMMLPAEIVHSWCLTLIFLKLIASKNVSKDQWNEFLSDMSEKSEHEERPWDYWHQQKEQEHSYSFMDNLESIQRRVPKNNELLTPNQFSIKDSATNQASDTFTTDPPLYNSHELLRTYRPALQQSLMIKESLQHENGLVLMPDNVNGSTLQITPMMSSEMMHKLNDNKIFTNSDQKKQTSFQFAAVSNTSNMRQKDLYGVSTSQKKLRPSETADESIFTTNLGYQQNTQNASSSMNKKKLSFPDRTIMTDTNKVLQQQDPFALSRKHELLLPSDNITKPNTTMGHQEKFYYSTPNNPEKERPQSQFTTAAATDTAKQEKFNVGTSSDYHEEPSTSKFPTISSTNLVEQQKFHQSTLKNPQKQLTPFKPDETTDTIHAFKPGISRNVLQQQKPPYNTLKSQQKPLFKPTSSQHIFMQHRVGDYYGTSVSAKIAPFPARTSTSSHALIAPPQNLQPGFAAPKVITIPHRLEEFPLAPTISSNAFIYSKQNPRIPSFSPIPVTNNMMISRSGEPIIVDVPFPVMASELSPTVVTAQQPYFQSKHDAFSPFSSADYYATPVHVTASKPQTSSTHKTTTENQMTQLTTSTLPTTTPKPERNDAVTQAIINHTRMSTTLLPAVTRMPCCPCCGTTQKSEDSCASSSCNSEQQQQPCCGAQPVQPIPTPPCCPSPPPCCPPPPRPQCCSPPPALPCCAPIQPICCQPVFPCCNNIVPIQQHVGQERTAIENGGSSYNTAPFVGHSMGMVQPRSTFGAIESYDSLNPTSPNLPFSHEPYSVGIPYKTYSIVTKRKLFRSGFKKRKNSRNRLRMRRDTLDIRARACLTCLTDRRKVLAKINRQPKILVQLQSMMQHQEPVKCDACRSESQYKRRVKRLGCIPCHLRMKRELEIEDEHKRTKRLGCIPCFRKKRESEMEKEHRRAKRLRKINSQGCIPCHIRRKREIEIENEHKRAKRLNDNDDFDINNYDISDFKDLPTGVENEEASDVATDSSVYEQSKHRSSKKGYRSQYGYSFESPYICDKTCCDFSRCPPIPLEMKENV